MKRGVVASLVAITLVGVSGNPAAQEFLIDTVANGCKTEIATYCKDVTP